MAYLFLCDTWCSICGSDLWRPVLVDRLPCHERHCAVQTNSLNEAQKKVEGFLFGARTVQSSLAGVHARIWR